MSTFPKAGSRTSTSARVAPCRSGGCVTGRRRRRLSASEPPQAARSGSRRRHRALRPRQQGLVRLRRVVARRARNDGVKIVDVTRARRPAVAAVAKAPGRHFQRGHGYHPGRRPGDHGCRTAGVCTPRPQRIRLFDVKPRHPLFLSSMRTRAGVHELDLVVRPDGTALSSARRRSPTTAGCTRRTSQRRGADRRHHRAGGSRAPEHVERFEDSDLESVGGDPFVAHLPGHGRSRRSSPTACEPPMTATAHTFPTGTPASSSSTSATRPDDRRAHAVRSG